MFYILEKQNAELVELKGMVSLLVKNTTATRDNDEPSLSEGINFPLESEEALQALEDALLDSDTANVLVSVIRCTSTHVLL